MLSPDLGSVPVERVWKPYLEGKYQVSNLGEVKSFMRKPEGLLLKPTKNGSGFLRISTTLQGKPVELFIHKLVAELFLPPCESEEQILAFKNGDKTCVTSENLVWQSEDGKLAKGNRKLTDVDLEFIRAPENEERSLKELSEVLGVTENYISGIRTGKVRG
jgi:hypothetical protein